MAEWIVYTGSNHIMYSFDSETKAHFEALRLARLNNVPHYLAKVISKYDVKTTTEIVKTEIE